ncbi:MAG: hypothetical protein GX033_01320 [Firmicutes bacterium]|nr:hypothetical protein [Bacillota bacterium]
MALDRCTDLKAVQTLLENLLAAQADRPTPIALAQAQARLTQAEAELASWRRMMTDFTRLEISSRNSIEKRVGEHQAYMEELQRQLAAAAHQVRDLGGPFPVDWEQLWQQYQEYAKLKRKLQELGRAQAALYSAQHVADLAALERRALDLQNRVASVYLAWQTLVDEYPGLPSPAIHTHTDMVQAKDTDGGGGLVFQGATLNPRVASELQAMRRGGPMARPLSQEIAPSPDAVSGLQGIGRGVPVVRPQEQYDQLKAEVNILKSELANLQQEEENLLRRRAQLEGQTPLNLAIAYEELQELKRQEELLCLEVEALGLAYRELEAARIEYSANHRERLAQQASDYFQQITGQLQRRVELDTDFAVSLRGDEGQPIHLAQLSQGARDQLYLSLRLAIADLLAEDVRLPLILDDPFVNCDSERLERIRQALLKVAESRQIWLLTHNPALSDFLTP